MLSCRAMDRRAFCHSMIGGVATAAAVRTWPFRVYSFPSELQFLSIDELKRIYIERAMASLLAEARENIWIPSWLVPTLQRNSAHIVSSVWCSGGSEC